VTYSTLYYPLAALVGIRALAVVCVAFAVLGFAMVAGRRWGDSARWASRSAAVVLPAFVLTAAFPFLLGAALSLLAIAAMQRGRWLAFAGLCVLSAAASPLAFVLLGVVLLGAGIGDRTHGRTLVIGVATLAGVTGLLLLSAVLFPGNARYPFPLQALAPALCFSAILAALTWNVPEARALRFIALLEGAACIATFTVSSEIGEGITRLRFVALPIALLALALRRWRPRRLSILVALLASYWNVAPLVTSFANGTGDPSQRAGYWQPATRYLRAHLPPAFRVEVVDTERHWAAAYLPAAGIPLVRGWFRQDDFPQNEALYDRLTPAGYRRWLRGLGVRFVVLSDATLDYSAREEGALLRHGRSGLPVVWRGPHLEIFAVPAPRSIVTGPGRPQVLDFSRDRLALQLGAAGRYRVAVRYSPYWHASAGCVMQAADGMITLRVPRPATVRLRFSITASSLVGALVGQSSTQHCA
jgi:hypothetical protein